MIVFTAAVQHVHTCVSAKSQRSQTSRHSAQAGALSKTPFYCSERLKALACEFHSSEEAGTAANADRAGGRDTSESRADGAECAGAGPPWCIADTTSAVVDSVRDTNWVVYAASCADSLIGNRLCSGIQVCGLELSSPGPLDRGCSLMEQFLFFT